MYKNGKMQLKKKVHNFEYEAHYLPPKRLSYRKDPDNRVLFCMKIYGCYFDASTSSFADARVVSVILVPPSSLAISSIF